MTRQLHAAVPTSETPGSRLQKAEHSNEGSMSSIEFLRSTMGLQTAAQILAMRPRRKVWSRGGFGCEGHGKRANSHGLSQSVAERCCGALGGKLPTRLAGPRDHPE